METDLALCSQDNSAYNLIWLASPRESRNLEVATTPFRRPPSTSPGVFSDGHFHPKTFMISAHERAGSEKG